MPVFGLSLNEPRERMASMPQLQQAVMEKLYGGDIWTGFSAVPQSEVQGWNGHHPSLSKLTSTPGPKIVVDVGVWKGQSTINMATAMRDAGIDGVVIGVDTFLGSPEHWDMNLFNRNNGLPDLYQIFLSNVVAAGLTDYVIPLAQTSTTAVRVLQSRGIAPQIVHVDAAHEYPEVIRDLEDYWSILDEGGYIIGDDYDISWPGVIQAAGEFSAKVRRPLLIEPPKFTLRK
jgi:hypothetical protein